MMHISTDNGTSLAFDHSGSLSLAKLNSLSIDLLDLLSSQTPFTPSNLSASDSISVKTEDDIFKSSICGENFTLKSIESFSSAELRCIPGILDKKMTLGEIISKRNYTKRPKVDF
jgi:hypothetical protein